jgi:hypothetical protein
MSKNGRTAMSYHGSDVALAAVRAVLSDDHSAEAGEAAVRQIIALVIETGGIGALADLTAELVSKLAELVERAATASGLPAIDVADILFVDSVQTDRDRE